MKTYNQIKAYFNLGPVDMHRPIADIGNMKSPYNRPRFGINASKKKKEKKENNIKEELQEVLDVQEADFYTSISRGKKPDDGRKFRVKLKVNKIGRIGPDELVITGREKDIIKYAIAHLNASPRIKDLGTLDLDIGIDEKKEERNYRNEYDNYHKKPEQRERNAARLRARRLMDRWGRVKRFDKKDVHHKDNNPLNNEEDNLAVTTQKWNRTEPRLRLTKSIRGK